MRRSGWILGLVLAAACAREPAPQTQEAAQPPAPETEPPTLDRVAAELEIELAQLEEPETFRSGRKAKPIVPLYPRGDVRLEDLDEFRVDVTADFAYGGNIEFRRGKTVLHEEFFEPDGFKNVRPIPDKVRAALKEGAVVTWGFYPEKGRAVTAKFSVVDHKKRMRSRWDKLEKKAQEMSDAWADTLRAQLLLDKRLYYPAWRKAKQALRHPIEDPSHLYAIMQAALRRMKLTKTELWKEVADQVKKRGRFGFTR